MLTLADWSEAAISRRHAGRWPAAWVVGVAARYGTSCRACAVGGTAYTTATAVAWTQLRPTVRTTRPQRLVTDIEAQVCELRARGRNGNQARWQRCSEPADVQVSCHWRDCRHSWTSPGHRDDADARVRGARFGPLRYAAMPGYRRGGPI